MISLAGSGDGLMVCSVCVVNAVGRNRNRRRKRFRDEGLGVRVEASPSSQAFRCGAVQLQKPTALHDDRHQLNRFLLSFPFPFLPDLVFKGTINDLTSRNSSEKMRSYVEGRRKPQGT